MKNLNIFKYFKILATEEDCRQLKVHNVSITHALCNSCLSMVSIELPMQPTLVFTSIHFSCIEFV